MHYIYCFVREAKRDEAPLPCGFEGRGVSLVSVADIGAVVSEGNPNSLGGTVDNILVHQQVIEKAGELFCSVIPCRFGLWLADATDVRALLRKNASQLATYLTRLAGKAEIEIAAILKGRPQRERAPMAGLTVGETYLLTKREQRRRAAGVNEHQQKFSQELNQSTAPFWTAVKTEEAFSRSQCILRHFYLVEREKIGFFEKAYLRMSQQRPHRKLLYSGPWPPYSFADMTLSGNEPLPKATLYSGCEDVQYV